jgi:acetylornithine deacetylase/succinyl-diaminopimelate desuccinylase-like protein
VTERLQRVFDDIDENEAGHVELLRDLITRPSRTGHLDEVTLLAGHLVDVLGSAGWSARQVPVPDLAPVVYAEHPAPPGGKTLLAYSHYDVISPEPLDEWDFEPFAATRVDDRIYGRGSTDAKANLLALILAMDTFVKLDGAPRLGMKLMLDGDEERGSPGLPIFIDENESDLEADAALSFDGAVDVTGVPKIGLGTGGMVFVELSCEGAPSELHSAKSRLFVNPAWRLVWALASIKDMNEKVLLDGFEGDIEAPSDRDRMLMESMPWDDHRQLQEAGLDRFLGDVKGRDAVEKLLFQPGVTLCGIEGGYTGPGPKAVIPSRASAKLEFRIVPGQRPDRVLEQLRSHLARQGFDDVSVEALALVETAKTDPDAPVVGATVAAASELYGPPMLKPTEEYAGRQGAWLGERLGIPGVQTGVGPPHNNAHAANEFVTVDHFIMGIKYAAAIYDRYAAHDPAPETG